MAFSGVLCMHIFKWILLWPRLTDLFRKYRKIWTPIETKMALVALPDTGDGHTSSLYTMVMSCWRLNSWAWTFLKIFLIDYYKHIRIWNMLFIVQCFHLRNYVPVRQTSMSLGCKHCFQSLGHLTNLFPRARQSPNRGIDCCLMRKGHSWKNELQLIWCTVNAN